MWRWAVAADWKRTLLGTCPLRRQGSSRFTKPREARPDSCERCAHFPGGTGPRPPPGTRAKGHASSAARVAALEAISGEIRMDVAVG